MRGAGLALALPVVFLLGLRLLMTIFLQSENRNADNLLKGLIQGILMYHAILSENQPIIAALFLGIGGRLVGDFSTQRDGWKVASTLLGIAFGVVMADVVSHLYEDTEWTTIEVLDDIEDTCSVEGRSRRSVYRRRVSEPRRIEELPDVHEELSSIDSRSRMEDAAASSDIEKEVARLRAKALHAAGQRRRFREERKWAWSQGNFARALQLRWQVKKYQALADSFTREADRKLIEADRAKRKPPSPPLIGRHHCHSDREPAPFVQVVVERGAHERDLVDREFIDVGAISPEQSRKVESTISRTTENFTTRRPGGVQIASKSSLTRSEHERDIWAIPVGSGDQSPPTSDTWSRQLD